MYCCYLICFAESLSGRRHYIGMTEKTVLNRFREHASGVKTSKLTGEALKKNVEFWVTRMWADVPAEYERQLKKRNGAATMCPRCNPKTWQQNARYNYTVALNVSSKSAAGLPVPGRTEG